MQGKKQLRNLLLNITSCAATAAVAIAVVFALTVVLSQSTQAQTPATGGGWTEQVLYSFGYLPDGISPSGGLIFDTAGNLYGTTSQGGEYSSNCNLGCGTAFELTPAAGGGWTHQVLHTFTNNPDGALPSAGLIFDAAGNLYGTTSQGGTYPYGTVFELMPAAGGKWTEQVLHSFDYTDGWLPSEVLVFDAGGNLYGTTAFGGTYNQGTVFELTPTVGGGWTEKALHNFNYSVSRADGWWPASGLIFDAAGDLYGTTYYGGISPNAVSTASGYGTAFELTPAGGSWTEKMLHSFNLNGTDGD